MAYNLLHISTPAGLLLAVASEQGLLSLEFVKNRDTRCALKQLSKKLKGEAIPGRNDILTEVEKQLNEYFAGERWDFQIPLQPYGTPFQLSAWKSLGSILYGTTITYKRQAYIMGNARAIRATASANAFNPIAILIPCHRVVGSNGNLTGYAGGLLRKRWLLEHERINSQHAPGLFDLQEPAIFLK